MEGGEVDANEGVAIADVEEEKEKLLALEEGVSAFRDDSFSLFRIDVPKDSVVGGVLESAADGNEVRFVGRKAIPFRLSSKLVFRTVGLGGGFFIVEEGTLSNCKLDVEGGASLGEELITSGETLSEIGGVVEEGEVKSMTSFGV